MPRVQPRYGIVNENLIFQPGEEIEKTVVRTPEHISMERPRPSALTLANITEDDTEITEHQVSFFRWAIVPSLKSMLLTAIPLALGVIVSGSSLGVQMILTVLVGAFIAGLARFALTTTSERPKETMVRETTAEERLDMVLDRIALDYSQDKITELEMHQRIEYALKHGVDVDASFPPAEPPPTKRMQRGHKEEICTDCYHWKPEESLCYQCSGIGDYRRPV